jgi:hypothetical protein
MRDRRNSRPLSALCALAALCAAFAPRPGWAGGPVFVSLSERPAVWPAGQTIGYRIDPGPLGAFGHDPPAQWVRDAFQQWQAVENARLSFVDRGALSSDVNGTNIMSFVNNPPAGVVSVIFDSDGKALDQLLGRGAGALVEGVGFPVLTVDLILNGRIGTAWCIFSGRALAGHHPEYVRCDLLHELGHTLGLGHSQINAASVWDGTPDHDALGPCMSYYWGPNTPAHLTQDDRSWIAALYPSEQLAAATGAIRGRILLADGVTPVQGLNVIARREGDGAVTAVSVVSGYRYKSAVGLGGRNLQVWGLYEIPGLPPGTYRVGVEPLLETPGMSPRSTEFPGARSFWREDPAGDPSTATPISVAAGQVVSGKDIRLPGEVAAPKAVNEAEPNDDPDGAQAIPVQAAIAGHADPAAGGSLPQPLSGGRQDRIQDWYRFTLTEPSLVTVILTATNAVADFNLYLFDSGEADGEPRVLERSVDALTPPETIQLRLPPGDYFAGVSVPNANGPASDYRLRLITVAAPQPAAGPGPMIQAVLVGDVTERSARVTWLTDQPSNSTVLIGADTYSPSLTDEFGSPELTQAHAVVLNNLSPETLYFNAVNSRNADGGVAFPAILSFGLVEPLVPGVFATASRLASTGPPRLSVRLVVADDWVRPDDRLVIVLIINQGGPAADVRLDTVTPTGDWALAGTPTGPFTLGALGTRATGQAIFRLSPTSGSAGDPGLRLQGSYAKPDGTRGTFGS